MTTENTQPRTRQELYDRVRRGSREEVILEEMIRLGFWPAAGELPHDPADEIRRRGELQRELDRLRGENKKLHDETRLLKELRQRRLAESRQKQQATKARREQERKERAEAWRKQKQTDITYLGAGVSGGLNYTAGNVERLQSYGLPSFNSAAELAAAMDVTVNELRFLSFHRKTATMTHYQRFAIPKKTGGERVISAPMPRLKAAQHWVLHNVLEKIELHDAAHGFRAGKSIVSNARPHVGAEVVINMDLQDFFPTIEYKRVKGLFRALGYSEAAATIFGLLCTEPEVEKVELDGRDYYVALGARHLPQGAPTSPAITNIMCRRLDRRLTKLAEKCGFTYTRYADDLTFSASGEALKNICNVLRGAESIVAHEGFAVHPAKTRVMRQARQQEVTGIVVNEQLGICKKELKRFRAVLFQVEKDGPDGKHWGQAPDVLASLLGYAHFVFMVDPVKGAEYQRRVRALIDKYDWQPRVVSYRKPAKAVAPPSITEAGAEPNAPPKSKKKWWQFWV